MQQLLVLMAFGPPLALSNGNPMPVRSICSSSASAQEMQTYDHIC